MVKVTKIMIVRIKKDQELKGNLESKEWENAFVNTKSFLKLLIN